ncbi:shikimate dehydrogenase [Staphylospora marina]|uniref:shikimate dehydrogenase n=1 Tax=Staphylospora marina TaxID=2490858 RepID=UPI000F5BE757|nr:shikimate dehydrogenase [Staphylospora marina]
MTEITARTVCYGLIGDPVSHSRSPEMMNAALSAMGEPAVYLAWRVETSRLKQAVEGLRSLGVCGWNVTIPHKVSVMDFLDELTPEARAIGAVNTVVNRDGVLTGTNTDGTGYLHSLMEDAGVLPDGIRVVLLGAGGAARATGYALARAGVRHMTVAARTAEKAEELARRLDSLTSVDALPLAEARRAVQEADLLVQCTPVGMHPETDAMPIPADWIREGQTVSDLVYRPRWTRLLREAAARGARVHDGTGMLIRQAAEALRIWTGKKAPVSLMKQVLDTFQ